MAQNDPVTRDEFLMRFKAALLRAGEKFDDGESIAAYADDIGPTYWDDPEQRAAGPEECAEMDMSEWTD